MCFYSHFEDQIHGLLLRTSYNNAAAVNNNNNNNNHNNKNVSLTLNTPLIVTLFCEPLRKNVVNDNCKLLLIVSHILIS